MANNSPDNVGVIFLTRWFSKNISKTNVDLNPTNDFLSNILWIYDEFQS